MQANIQSGKYYQIHTFPEKFPKDIIRNKKLSIGFDPKIINKKILHIFFGKNSCYFKPLKNNLIDKIWKRKIKKNNKKFYKLPDHSVSEKYSSKILKIVDYLKRKKADFLFITASENNVASKYKG